MITIDGRSWRVIDSHVHIFPIGMIEQRETWLLRDRWFADLYGNPKSRLATAEDLITSMDLAGIDQSIVSGFPWRDNEHCRVHNAYMAESCARFPDRLFWIGICSPGADGAKVAADCFADGAVGLGEFNADAQGFKLADSVRFQAVAEVAIAADRPVLIHSSEPVGHTYPGKGAATPDHLLALAQAFPDLRIVAAHWGGGLPFFELMPEVRGSLGNVVYDSGATTYLYDHRIFNQVIEIAGANKVLFASDYPVLGQQRLLARMAVMEWAATDAIGPVLAGNAIRTFRLEMLN